MISDSQLKCHRHLKKKKKGLKRSQSQLSSDSDSLETYFPSKLPDSDCLLTSVCVSLCLCRDVPSHLGQLLLGGKAQSEDGVGPAVCPLAKLLWRLGKRHVGCDGAVDDYLLGQNSSFSKPYWGCGIKSIKNPRSESQSTRIKVQLSAITISLTTGFMPR